MARPPASIFLPLAAAAVAAAAGLGGVIGVALADESDFCSQLSIVIAEQPSNEVHMRCPSPLRSR